MADLMYGERKLQGASNIVFTNGLLDPWSSGGVLRTISKSVVSLIIPEGAHHLDLRGADPADPPSVTKARNIERQYIKKWIEEAADNNSTALRFSAVTTSHNIRYIFLLNHNIYTPNSSGRLA